MQQSNTHRGTVVILATGGTIAGVGDEGKTTGYRPGTIDVNTLVRAVPWLERVANIETLQMCNLNSDDITDVIWLRLVETINRLAMRPDVRGFVITHGTDTLEETAYFLNLTVKTEKPVVLTGSMRPATSISPDGPMNLYQSVCVAASPKAVGMGVLAVFSDRIYSARSVKKNSTYHVTAISAGEMGAMGLIRDGEVYIYEKPARLHTIYSEFDVATVKRLPRVSVLYFSVDADPELLNFAAHRANGIVIAGAGAGGFSLEYMERVSKLTVPVVVSSRIDDGIITYGDVLCKNAVASNSLPPQKAAILLRLALTRTSDYDALVEMFEKY